MEREKVDNKLNVVIGTKTQIEGDTSIPENSIIIVTDEVIKADEIVYSVEKNVKEAIEDLETSKQEKLVAGENITINPDTNIISASDYTETDPIFTAWNKSTGISITKSQVSDLIEATQALSGLMSATDKTRLDVLHALLEEDTENNVVDSINEVLAIFNNYPEGADLVTALAGKVDKVSGKGLTKNEFTDEYKNKVDNQLVIGVSATQAYRGDLGQTAYNHSQSTHAPSNAQKNSDITKTEIEAKLTGEITSHSHALPTHNHDDRYYTENEVDTKLGSKAEATHTHTKSQITDFPTSMPPTAHSTNLLTSGTLGIARGGTGRTDGYAVGVVETRASVLTKIWTGTQAQYDAIGTKDVNTLYFII